MPCRHFSLPTDSPERQSRPARQRLPAMLATLGMLPLLGPWGPSAMAAPAAPAAAPAPATPVVQAAAAPAPAESELMARARAWLAQAHQVSPAAVTVQPPDVRLQAGSCASGWSFDRPFPQNERVLRARCPDTQWQLYLTVSLPREAVAARPPAPPAIPPAPVAWAPTPVAAGPAAAPLAPLAVRRGHTVVTTWSPAPGLQVSARLESLDDGRVGDAIRVRNRDTGRILSAFVSGQGQALGQ